MTKYFESNVSHFSSLLSVIASVSACYSETLVRMPTEGQTPSWLISYKISLCYLLSLIAVLSNIHTALNSNETRERDSGRRTALRQRVCRGWCTWTRLLSPDFASVKNCMLPMMLPDFLWIIEIVSEDITRLLRDWCLHYPALLTRMPRGSGLWWQIPAISPRTRAWRIGDWPRVSISRVSHHPDNVTRDWWWSLHISDTG